jgi:hypothetical protein
VWRRLRELRGEAFLAFERCSRKPVDQVLEKK